MSKEVITYINENLYGIWFLIGAALVFWMQAGFAMVETGFTRAKNHHEKPDGLLYWNRDIHFDRCIIALGRGFPGIYRKTRLGYFYSLQRF